MYEVQPQYRLNDNAPKPRERSGKRWPLVVAGLIIGILIGISR